MRLKKTLISILLFSFVFSAAGWQAKAQANDSLPKASMPDSDGLEMRSRSAFLFDNKANKPLFARNSDEILPLASLTKLMTALIVYEMLPDWNELIVIEASDARNGGIPYFIAGDEVTRNDLWHLMLIASSNDAAAALARSLGFSEEDFARMMNRKAYQLGLRRLFFVDVTGLSPQNIGSAREAAALARIVLTIPKARETLTKEIYLFTPSGKKTRRALSTNLILSSVFNNPPYYIVGGKTGYLEESQYNFIFAAGKKESESSRHLIGVVLGSPTSEDRFQEMINLTDWGFDKKLYQ